MSSLIGLHSRGHTGLTIWLAVPQLVHHPQTRLQIGEKSGQEMGTILEIRPPPNLTRPLLKGNMTKNPRLTQSTRPSESHSGLFI